MPSSSTSNTIRAVRQRQTSSGPCRMQLLTWYETYVKQGDAGLDIDALAHADMGQTFLENHAAYLKGWLSEIKRGPDAYARAASSASKAADFLCDRRSQLLAGEIEGREPTRFRGKRGGAALRQGAFGTGRLFCFGARRQGILLRLQPQHLCPSRYWPATPINNIFRLALLSHCWHRFTKKRLCWN